MNRISDLVSVRFVEGGRDPREGLDCWGLAVEVFRRFGIELPDYRLDCESVAAGVNDHAEKWVLCTGEPPAPALIVFMTFGICDHVGVYLGGGRFTHAHETMGVVITSTSHPFWKKRIEGYYVPGWC